MTDLSKLPDGVGNGVPIIGARRATPRPAFPEVLATTVLKPGERLIVTLPGDANPAAVRSLALNMIASGIERPILVADWVGLSCVEPDTAALVDRILALRQAISQLCDDIARLRQGPRARQNAGIDAVVGVYQNRLTAILMADAVNPNA